MKTSWYTEPWAWLVFFLPFSAVVAGTATYFIANHEPDTLVIGEYYKEGKTINVEVSKVKRAQKLGMRFGLKFTDNEIIIKPTGIDKIFPLLNISFFHPTQEHKDFKMTLTPDGKGYFRYKIEDDKVVTGKWRITLRPFDESWKIQNTIYLPQTDFIDLIPDITQAN